MEKKKILLVEDHKMFRDGIRAIIEQTDKYEIAGESANGISALEFLESNEVDLILMDIKMPVMDGIECSKKIIENKPDAKILAITMHEEEQHIRNMLKAGASGYILKNAGVEILIGAMDSVLEGNKYYGEHVTRIIMEELTKTPEQKLKENPSIYLTKREKDVLQLIVKEKSNQEIADKLFISIRTVDAHRRNLLQKIGAKNSVGLAKFALSHNLFDID